MKSPAIRKIIMIDFGLNTNSRFHGMYGNNKVWGLELPSFTGKGLRILAFLLEKSGSQPKFGMEPHGETGCIRRLPLAKADKN